MIRCLATTYILIASLVARMRTVAIRRRPSIPLESEVNLLPSGTGTENAPIWMGNPYAYSTGISTASGTGSARLRLNGPFKLSEAMDVTAINWRLDSMAAGTFTYRLLIYAGTAGSSTPGAFVWASPEYTLVTAGFSGGQLITQPVTGLSLTAGYYWIGWWSPTLSPEPQHRYRNSGDNTYLQKWQLSYTTPAYAATGNPGAFGTASISATREFIIWVEGSPPALTAPGTPTFSATSPRTVVVSWTAGDARTQVYRVERSTDGVSWLVVALVDAARLTYTNTGVLSSTLYYYRVVACYRSAETASASASVVTSSTTATVQKSAIALMAASSNVNSPIGQAGAANSSPVLTALGTNRVRQTRVNWGAVQPNYGAAVYDWSSIDTFLTACAAADQRGIVRLRGIVPNTNACPTGTPGTTVGSTFVPTWNTVLATWNAMVSAFAANYNGNLQLAGVECGFDGEYGEIRNYGTVGDAYKASDADLVAALTHWASVVTKPTTIAIGGDAGYLASLLRSTFTSFSIRQDGFGTAASLAADQILFWAMNEEDRARWHDRSTGLARQGRLRGEWFTPSGITEADTPAVAETQRLRLRPATMFDGNMTAVPTWSAGNQTTVQDTLRLTGVRMGITSAVLPTTFTTGVAGIVEIALRNTGNVRGREPYYWRFELWDGSSAVETVTITTPDVAGAVVEDGIADICYAFSVTFSAAPAGGYTLVCRPYVNPPWTLTALAFAQLANTPHSSSPERYALGSVTLL